MIYFDTMIGNRNSIYTKEVFRMSLNLKIKICKISRLEKRLENIYVKLLVIEKYYLSSSNRKDEDK